MKKKMLYVFVSVVLVYIIALVNMPKVRLEAIHHDTSVSGRISLANQHRILKAVKNVDLSHPADEYNNELITGYPMMSFSITDKNNEKIWLYVWADDIIFYKDKCYAVDPFDELFEVLGQSINDKFKTEKYDIVFYDAEIKSVAFHMGGNPKYGYVYSTLYGELPIEFFEQAFDDEIDCSGTISSLFQQKGEGPYMTIEGEKYKYEFKAVSVNKDYFILKSDALLDPELENNANELRWSYRFD